MIHIVIYKDINDHYKGFECMGHAGYDDHGYDIVCSAVSVLTINTVNSIEMLTSSAFSFEDAEEGGYMKMMFHDTPDHDAVILMEAMIMGLGSLEDTYSDFIKLVIEEV
jgi:hypothetical protein